MFALAKASLISLSDDGFELSLCDEVSRIAGIGLPLAMEIFQQPVIEDLSSVMCRRVHFK